VHVPVLEPVLELAITNSPLTENRMELSAKSPVLVTVTVCAGESCPSAVSWNVSELGIRLSVGAAAPLPLSNTVCVPALSAKVKVPAAAPDCVGVNVTFTEQAFPAASAAVPQAFVKFVDTENGPVTPIEVNVTG